MATWKIYPVFLGENDMDSAFMTTGGAPGTALRIGIGSIALKSNETGEVILLDTGICPYHEAIEKDYKCYHETGYDDKDPRMKEITFDGALAKLGIKPEDVKKIGLTHLHWDHCWNLDMFPEDIPIYVQKEELKSAITCSKPERHDYQMLPEIKEYPTWIRRMYQMETREGDYELAPGVQAIFTPGHTYGHQAFVIDTEEGKYVYAGDQYYDPINWEGEGNITGWFADIAAWYNSHKRIKAINAVGILAVHDLGLYKREFYG